MPIVNICDQVRPWPCMWQNNTWKCFLALALTFSANACAATTPSLLAATPNYTVLDANQYQHIVATAQQKVRQILQAKLILPLTTIKNSNATIAFIVQQLRGIPYIFTDGMGEGDWQPQAQTYQPGAVHVQQNPVYRFDGLNCQTFVQVVMALFYSQNLAQFDHNLLKISYGAAGNPNGDIVRYYNRNNFIEGDWNRINRKNGFLLNATTQGEFAKVYKTTTLTLTRQQWFLKQQKNLVQTVQVLDAVNGPAMSQRFMTTYAHLNYPHFGSQAVTISYLPKTELVQAVAISRIDPSRRRFAPHPFESLRGERIDKYVPNQALFAAIPTPSVVEFVRDTHKWMIAGKNIKELIGTELGISHMGLLYRQTFPKGTLIYHQITCHLNQQNQKICVVTPIVCHQKECPELMFAQATNAYPKGYFWYKAPNGNEVCTMTPPAKDIIATQCNQVLQEPLFAYLTNYQYGAYTLMDNPSILGIHIEKLEH